MDNAEEKAWWQSAELGPGGTGNPGRSTACQKPSRPLLPARPHLLKALQPLQVASEDGGQVVTHMSLKR